MRAYRKILAELIRGNTPEPTLGAEIGVWRGELSEELLKTFPTLTLIAVDPWDAKCGGYSPDYLQGIEVARADFYHRMAPFGKRLIIYELPSMAAIRRVANGCLDFSFLDANHTYDAVKQDTEWFSKVRSGGLFCGHDYGGKNNTKGIFGVTRAVDEWAAANNRTLNFVGRGIWWCRK